LATVSATETATETAPTTAPTTTCKHNLRYPPNSLGHSWKCKGNRCLTSPVKGESLTGTWNCKTETNITNCKLQSLPCKEVYDVNYDDCYNDCDSLGWGTGENIPGCVRTDSQFHCKIKQQSVTGCIYNVDATNNLQDGQSLTVSKVVGGPGLCLGDQMWNTEVTLCTFGNVKFTENFPSC
jgi:hypothetical protein